MSDTSEPLGRAIRAIRHLDDAPDPGDLVKPAADYGEGVTGELTRVATIRTDWGTVELSDAGVSIDGGRPIAWGGPR